MTSPQITHDEQRQLVRALGVDDAPEEVTVEALRGAVEERSDAELASMGEAIREDLSGRLDEDLLANELDALVDAIGRVSEVREAGVPDGDVEPERLYRELAAPGWRIYEHLVEAGFFESVEENLPRFEPEHIESTAHELIRSRELMEPLSAAGLDDHQRLALVTNVVTNTTRLARWVPTKEIPADVEFDVEHVPPLGQRAMGGALLWITAMDVHLWQKRILVTDEILDDGAWHVTAMLAGMAVLARAAVGVAEGENLTDAELTAALSAGAAICIVTQEEICKDVFWITEEMRAPPRAR